MRDSVRWTTHCALWMGAPFLGFDAVEGQTAESKILIGSYATCSEAWGHSETLSLNESGFRHFLDTDLSEKAVRTGHYHLRDSRLVIVADSGPAEPAVSEDVVLPSPPRFDSAAYIVDTVATIPVLWRSAEFQSKYRTSGTLNKYGVLVRTGPPGDTISRPHCQDEFGKPFDEQRTAGQKRPNTPR